MSKYGNIKTVIDNITFASKREANRYAELKLLVRAGEINELVLQPRFDLKYNGQKICTYVADFAYNGFVNGKLVAVVEDAKGVKTPVYRLKKKLMKAAFGIEVREV